MEKIFYAVEESDEGTKVYFTTEEHWEEEGGLPDNWNDEQHLNEIAARNGLHIHSESVFTSDEDADTVFGRLEKDPDLTFELSFQEYINEF